MSSNRDEAVFEEVAQRLGGRLLRHDPLAGGVSARVEAMEILLAGGETRRVVLRLPGAAAWKAQAADTTRREFELLEWLHARGLPVPRPLLIDLSRAVSPRPFFVMEHIEGSREIADLSTALPHVADLLALVHGLPLDVVPPLPEREDPVAGLLEFLPPGHDALRARLVDDPPRLSPRRALLHGDYWPGNLLWRDRALVGLIDWEDAALGDPLSDVACCRLELRYKYGHGSVEAFTVRYAGRVAWDLGELPLWDAYVAAAALASMGHWGLDPAVEAHMRREAEASLREASEVLR